MTEIKAPGLSPHMLQLAEHRRNLWSVTVAPGIPVDSVKNPEFWVHCAKMVKAGDKIECHAQDNSWYAELKVAKVEPQAVHVWVVLYSDLRAQTARAQSVADFKVEFGGRHKWRVIRLHDGEVVHKDEADESAARAWLDQYVKASA